jgi:hypothetical protein
MNRLVALALFALPVGMLSQTVTVMSAHFSDSSGNPLSGYAYFQPVNCTGGFPMSYRMPGGGTVMSNPVQVVVNAGAMSLTLPDTTQTYPANICFAMTYPQGTLPVGYSTLQPHTTAYNAADWCQAGVCNLDNYMPGNQPLPTLNAVQSINYVGGQLTFTGAGVSQSGNTFTFSGGGGGGINQLIGDATAGPGSGSQALTLATVNSGSGACGDATHVCQVTTNAKGLTTSQSAVSISGASAAPSLDVTQIAAPGEVISTYQQQIVVPVSSTVTIADLKGFSGTVVGWAIALCPGSGCSGAGYGMQTVVSVYYDGNTGTPDFSAAGYNFGNIWQQTNTTFASDRITSGMSNAANTTGTFGFYYPMYFNSEWRMTLTAPAGATNGIKEYLTVWYTKSYTNSLRLHNATVVQQAVNLATTPLTLLNVASGGGIVAGIFMNTDVAADLTYNEANVQTYLDGATAIAQVLPAGGSSGAGCSVGDVLGVTQSGGSGGEVTVLAVNSGAVVALTPTTGSLGTGYSTASGLSTTAVSTTCSVRPTVYISTAQNSNDSVESYLQQSLDYGIGGTRQAPYGFVSTYEPSGNTFGWTVFFDLLDYQKGPRFTNGITIKWQADPIKAANVDTSVTVTSNVLYYQ